MTVKPTNASRLLVDANVLVLFAVGTVNRHRIETFKRTRQYKIQDFELLLRVFERWQSLYTVPHVLAEVSNLTDLTGVERQRVRQVLKKTISVLVEVAVPSAQATEDSAYPSLGLVDAAIAVVARTHRCAVLTDDLDLYLLLQCDQIEVLNFTHLRAQAFGCEPQLFIQ